MDKKTKAKYLKRFEFHMSGIKADKYTVKHKLIELANQQTGNTWRETRNAFAFAVEHHSKRWGRGDDKRINKILEFANELRKLDNPVPIDQRKKPKKIIKKVSDSDLEKLKITAKSLNNNDGIIAESVITIMNLTGARPNEIPLIMKFSDNVISIPGSKKSEKRGLDRELHFADKRDVLIIMDRVKLINKLIKAKDKTKKMRESFKICAQKTFPRRANLPTPYTLRHQYGSNLKGSGLDRVSIAYMMGHQATASVEQYGNGKSASGSAVKASPAHDLDIIKTLIRETHKEHYSPPEKIESRENDYKYQPFEFT